MQAQCEQPRQCLECSEAAGLELQAAREAEARQGVKAPLLHPGQTRHQRSRELEVLQALRHQLQSKEARFVDVWESQLQRFWPPVCWLGGGRCGGEAGAQRECKAPTSKLDMYSSSKAPSHSQAHQSSTQHPLPLLTSKSRAWSAQSTCPAAAPAVALASGAAQALAGALRPCPCRRRCCCG